MISKYLIRLDDINEGTNWDTFTILEKIFDKYQIKPIIGVIPENKDKSLVDKKFEIDRNIFFTKIRNLHSKGYHIAMHGVTHELRHSKDTSLIDIQSYGEFCDMNQADCYHKIKYGVSLFESMGLHTKIFMPPAHWISKQLIEALNKNSFNIVTDGLFSYPKKINNIWFIPQQLWKQPRFNLPGIHTICLHINNITDNQLQHIINWIEPNKNRFVNLDDIKIEEYDNSFFKLYNSISYILYKTFFKIRNIKNNYLKVKLNRIYLSE